MKFEGMKKVCSILVWVVHLQHLIEATSKKCVLICIEYIQSLHRECVLHQRNSICYAGGFVMDDST